jgi:hypothetical protein
MPVPITSIIRGCLNKDSRSNFDNNKIVISLTVKISEALRYDRLHSRSLGLINFDDSLTNYEILQVSFSGDCHKLLAQCHKYLAAFFTNIWLGQIRRFQITLAIFHVSVTADIVYA